MFTYKILDIRFRVSQGFYHTQAITTDTAAVLMVLLILLLMIIEDLLLVSKIRHEWN